MKEISGEKRASEKEQIQKKLEIISSWKKAQQKQPQASLPHPSCFKNRETVASMDSSVEVPYKTTNKVTTWPSDPTPGHTSRKKPGTQKNTCTPTFMATLFTTAKTWKQPKRPPIDEWVKKTWRVRVCGTYINGIFFSHIKE